MRLNDINASIRGLVHTPRALFRVLTGQKSNSTEAELTCHVSHKSPTHSCVAIRVAQQVRDGRMRHMNVSQWTNDATHSCVAMNNTFSEVFFIMVSYNHKIS